MEESFFELDIKTLIDPCDHCEWDNEPFEEEPNDGGAPCKKCKYWNGVD